MVTILHGDAIQQLRTLDAESVQCCVTSPPYFGLRDYGEEKQIGMESTPDAYVAALVAVFVEVWRVLKNDGTLWIVIGDSYVTKPIGSGSTFDPKWKNARNRKEGLRANRTNRPEELGLKHKDLIGIPWLVAFALQKAGWYLRQDIIWHKPNPMPESVRDRPTTCHEHIFLLTKQPSYFYDADAIAEPATYAMHAQMEQGYAGKGKKDYARNGVQNPSDVKRRIIEGAIRRSVKRGGFNGKTNALPGREAFRAFKVTRNKRSVWSHEAENAVVWWLGEHHPVVAFEFLDQCIANQDVWKVTTRPYPRAHFATFPPALIEPCILAGSRRGDTILDPFAGSGTTGQVALKHSGRAILIELNAEFLPLIRERCGLTAPEVAAA